MNSLEEEPKIQNFNCDEFQLTWDQEEFNFHILKYSYDDFMELSITKKKKLINKFF